MGSDRALVVRANVEVTGAARLYRAASVWTAGLGTRLRFVFLVDLGLADLANSIMTIRLCFVSMKIRKALVGLARLAYFSHGAFHSRLPIIESYDIGLGGDAPFRKPFYQHYTALLPSRIGRDLVHISRC